MPRQMSPIHVYLFEDADRFHEFVREERPDFPNRRAFFVETDTRLEVYAHWGGYVGEDLRHEVTHAYLHSVLPSIPLWLDEGLAEYFEVPRGRQGLNRDHLSRVVAKPGGGGGRSCRDAGQSSGCTLSHAGSHPPRISALRSVPASRRLRRVLGLGPFSAAVNARSQAPIARVSLSASCGRFDGSVVVKNGLAIRIYAGSAG